MGDGAGAGMNGEREQGGDAPAFTESNPSTGSEESEQHWPEQRPMTPADFDRPFAPEPAEHRHVEHHHAEVRAMPERTSEPIAERAVDTRIDPVPASAPAAETEEKSSGERKRGWWKRVLS